jgi:CelD/BcsL family acetyltransferase involved in cellulose biosynthesis
MLHLEPLANSDALESLAPEWDALDRTLSPRTPFTSSLWNILWWRHFRENRPLVRDELCAFAVRDQDRRLVGVAPMMLTERPRSGPVRFRCLQFFGADSNLTELRGLICRPEHEQPAVELLLQRALARRASWDWLHLGAIRRDGAAHRRLDAAAGMRWRRELPVYCLDLPESWELFKAGLPRNIKESLRKGYNSLRRAGHEPRLTIVEHPEQHGAALDAFFALHTARAGAVGLLPHPNLFDSHRPRSFLIDYAQQMADCGALRLFQLEVGGSVVATRLGFEFGSELYLYYSGYDPAWNRFSVMTTLVAEAIKWAIARRLSLVNLSVGNDVSKTRWRPREVAYREAMVIAPHARGRIAYRLYDRFARAAHPASPLDRFIAAARRGRH